MSSSGEFYTNPGWDIDAWVSVIAVEYESLIGAFAFDDMFRAMGGTIRILDVGCGTAIFPTYLDRVLSDDVRIRADLLDRSRASLNRAAEVLGRLEHFTVGKSFLTRIEDLPALGEHRYDVIWAIHSLTTVDVDGMPEAVDRLIKALKKGGRLLVYQLTAASTYQRVHAAYRESRGGDRYMEYEDTVKLLDAAGYDYEVHELAFDHVVSDTQEALREYLAKVTLDDSVSPQLLEPMLDEFRSRGALRFPQTVNLIVVPEQG